MTRNPQRTVMSTWLLMLTLQTIGSVDVQHKLPAPKQFVAVSTLWGILFLMADSGLGKLAARLSLLVLLTASVLGPFGQKLVDFLNTVSKNFAVAPPQRGAGFGSASPGAGPAPNTTPYPNPLPTHEGTA